MKPQTKCSDSIGEKELRAIKLTIAVALVNLPPTPTRARILNSMTEGDEKLKAQLEVLLLGVN